MDLFSNTTNLLPYDGETLYYGHILSISEANRYFEALMHNIAWQHDEAIIYGKHYITKRKVAWYGNENYNYTYSNTTKQALPWTPELIALKQLVENITGTQFNSCLLNLYHTGEEGMAWHSDDEKALGNNTIIASLSLGAARKFSFKHKKTAEKRDIILEPGSLLVMQGTTQTHWLHRLPPTKTVKNARINLTFRSIVY
ncbi:DNA methylase [Flavobacterium akiainvivens]|uniref:DNA methylase n=1 Tax=Flavobacterium akiainvivens TaxID=1202724 RepID=A0A0M9VHT7_9FLAO|nr:alpha-ketoglutarate-dependent dioxygenase AlkB [Flavobacterium akiainvivens]KOS05920.1 DNA methylase [Flavobacterium akiainvivens]SFQ53240.1 Alkylated DNA repair dioxygenase AlkB [Flavobacterium akiainvivens]